MSLEEKKLTTIKKKKIDKKTFRRIENKFKQYWKYLFRLILIYIFSYLTWNKVLSSMIRDTLKRNNFSKKKSKESLFLMIILVAIQGLLFCLDGYVTSLLKTPFNQMCYAINKTEGIDEKKKDYIITKATESNEHCKETLKKFGVLTITIELITVFIEGEDLKTASRKKYGEYYDLLNISYLIPLSWAAFDIWLIHNELRKIKQKIILLKSAKKISSLL